MGKLFGTDGIRGVPWNFPFTEDFLSKIGYAVSLVISRSPLCPREGRRVLVGMDSRESCDKIKAALAKGMSVNDFQIVDIGIITTPAVSYLVKREGASFGVMISASHNPPEFNGIKFFSQNGMKLSDSAEERIEKILEGDISFAPKDNKLERIDCSGDYAQFIEKSICGNFKNLKVVLDCANGAAFRIAPRIFEELSADIRLIGNAPDGRNINLGCGALFPEKMQKKTVIEKAFCGVSFDGDADRCVFSDETGRTLNGDDLISIAAPYLKEKGKLKNNKVVLTFMSNCGLIKYLETLGIEVVQVAVGDKNVTDAIEKEGLSLGGESSGHVIFREFGPTGDGILTAVQVLNMAKESGKPLSFFKDRWKRFPQFVVSHRVSRKIPFEEIKGFNEKVDEMRRRLGGNGRIFIRYSGTEPLLRLLVEGEEEAFVREIAADIIEHYKRYGGEFDEKSKVRN